MKCPICNIELTMSERQGVEIDYCSKCRGVWLDRGELDKIIEKSAAEHPQPNPGQYSSSDKRKYDDDYDKGYKYKKRKGLLGDLFDF